MLGDFGADEAPVFDPFIFDWNKFRVLLDFFKGSFWVCLFFFFFPSPGFASEKSLVLP